MLETEKTEFDQPELIEALQVIEQISDLQSNCEACDDPSHPDQKKSDLKSTQTGLFRALNTKRNHPLQTYPESNSSDADFLILENVLEELL